MSFSGKIKEELGREYSNARHCRIAEIVAILSMCGDVDANSSDQVTVKISTENILVAKKYFTLIKKTFNIRTEISIRRNLIKKSVSYTVIIDGHEDASRVLRMTKFPTLSVAVKRTCCKRAFIRGAFLSSGSISNPEKSYHFEIVCATSTKAEQVRDVINSFAMDAKIVLRKKSYVVYLKEGAKIVDMLNIIEAHVALMELENVRIVKEMRGLVNRKVNCETANINKTVSAAVRQVEDIIYIRDTIGLHKLPESLEEIATARVDHQDATLKELGSLLTPAIGKSGVNHRLRKLSTIAQELRDKG